MMAEGWAEATMKGLIGHADDCSVYLKDNKGDTFRSDVFGNKLESWRQCTRAWRWLGTSRTQSTAREEICSRHGCLSDRL